MTARPLHEVVDCKTSEGLHVLICGCGWEAVAPTWKDAGAKMDEHVAQKGGQ